MQIDREIVEQALKALKDYERHTGFRSTATDDLRDALAQSEQEVKGCDHCNHPLYAALNEADAIMEEVSEETADAWRKRWGRLWGRTV
jgi:hypothetical protein